MSCPRPHLQTPPPHMGSPYPPWVPPERWVTPPENHCDLTTNCMQYSTLPASFLLVTQLRYGGSAVRHIVYSRHSLLGPSLRPWHSSVQSYLTAIEICTSFSPRQNTGNRTHQKILCRRAWSSKSELWIVIFSTAFYLFSERGLMFNIISFSALLMYYTRTLSYVVNFGPNRVDFLFLGSSKNYSGFWKAG